MDFAIILVYLCVVVSNFIKKKYYERLNVNSPNLIEQSSINLTFLFKLSYIILIFLRQSLQFTSKIF